MFEFDHVESLVIASSQFFIKKIKRSLWSMLKPPAKSFLEEIFDKDSLKIEDLLDAEDILTELKNNEDLFGKLFVILKI